MTRHRILVVEDDPAIRAGLVDALTLAAFDVREAVDGDAAVRTALAGQFDLILLDLMLPGKDGLAVLEEVRRDRPSLPVIILTARGREADRVAGLCGASMLGTAVGCMAAALGVVPAVGLAATGWIAPRAIGRFRLDGCRASASRSSVSLIA